MWLVFSIIGQLGGGKKNLSGIIDIAVMQLLVKGDEVKDIVRDYGSINFLSFGSSEESIMRLDSVQIANELIGTVEEMLQ